MGDISDALVGIVTRAQEACKAADGDYIGDDGLLYCGKCHTQKQCRVKWLGEMQELPIMCRCAKEADEVEQKSLKDAQRKARIERLRRYGIPKAYMYGWTFENDNGEGDRALMSSAKEYANKFREMYKKGKGLLLYGSPGIGKTYAAGCIANALIEREIPVLFTSFSRIAREMQETFSGQQDYLDELDRYDLLIIDDFNTERNTSYMNEIIASVIIGRCDAGLPMVITTNLTAKQMREPETVEQQRIFSKIMELCVPINCKGTDRRKDRLRSEYAEYKEILKIE